MTRPCIEPGCQQLAQPGRSRCTGHQQTWAAQRNRARRNRAHPTTGAAATRRRAINNTGGGTCNHCGTRHPSRHLEVDHIHPLADGGDDTPANTQVLCRECHATKTRHEQQQRIAARHT